MSCQQRLGARNLRVSIHVKFVIRCLLTEATTAFMPMHEVHLLYTEDQMTRTSFVMHLGIAGRIYETDPYYIDHDRIKVHVLAYGLGSSLCARA
ncbi:hypothetical protein C1879_04230 [Paraeggerthella hongkongensis]|nr:hypothetical protein C1879_04230 [Paraeggerthella hongkongensis]